MQKALNKERNENQHLQQEAKLSREEIQTLRQWLETPSRSPANVTVSPLGGHAHGTWSRSHSPSCACCQDSICGSNCRHKKCQDGANGSHHSHAASQALRTSPSARSQVTQQQTGAGSANECTPLISSGGNTCGHHHAGPNDEHHADAPSNTISRSSHGGPSVCAVSNASSCAGDLASYTSLHLSASELWVNNCEGHEEDPRQEEHEMQPMPMLMQDIRECKNEDATAQEHASLCSSMHAGKDLREPGKMHDADDCDEAKNIVAHIARFLSTHSPICTPIISVSS
jgi:hypothetical protein